MDTTVAQNRAHDLEGLCNLAYLRHRVDRLIPGRGSEGIERLPETRPYAFGDDLNLIDSPRSLENALRRTKGDLTLAEEDIEIFETEHLTVSKGG